MKFDYQPLVKTAERLIKRFGQDGFLRRPGNQLHPVSFVVLDYNPREADGIMINYTDKRVYMADAGIEPEQRSDLLIIENVPMEIISVRPLNPAGTVVYYELQVRR